MLTALFLLLSASAPPVSGPDVFVRACMGGEVRLPRATPIVEYADLSSSVRRAIRRSREVEIWDASVKLSTSEVNTGPIYAVDKKRIFLAPRIAGLGDIKEVCTVVFRGLDFPASEKFVADWAFKNNLLSKSSYDAVMIKPRRHKNVVEEDSTFNMVGFDVSLFEQDGWLVLRSKPGVSPHWKKWEQDRADRDANAALGSAGGDRGRAIGRRSNNAVGDVSEDR